MKLRPFVILLIGLVVLAFFFYLYNVNPELMSMAAT